MQRPTPVLVFGILNIVFAVFGVLGSLFSLVMFQLPFMRENPAIHRLLDLPIYVVWMRMMVMVGIVMAAAQLPLGIGLLFMKRWARRGCVPFAIISMFVAVAGQYINLIYVLPEMTAGLSGSNSPDAMGAFGGAIGGVFGGSMSLVYPVLLLIFMTRPGIVAAFETNSGPPPLPAGSR